MKNKALWVVLLGAAFGLFALAVLAPDAWGYVPRKGVPCHRGYATRHRVVVRGGHRRRVRVCVKRRAGSVPPPASRRVALHAHLDPSFTRDPLDPFRVTYQFSASATSETPASTSLPAAEEPAPLPTGVLALYSDGSLECAVNVGGAVGEGECPVSYAALGQHRVTTVYSSGEQSATTTELEQIEPLPTTTSLTAAFTPAPPHEADGGSTPSGVYSVGVLTAQTSGTLDGGAAPGAALVRLGSGGWEASVGGGSYGSLPEALTLHATTHPPAGYTPSEAAVAVPFEPTLPGHWAYEGAGTKVTQPAFTQAFSATYDKQTDGATPLHVRADVRGSGLSPCVTQLRVDGAPVSEGDEGKVVGSGGQQVDDFTEPAGPATVELWVSTYANTGGGPCEVWADLYASE